MGDDGRLCDKGPAKSRGRKVHWRRDPVILARLREVEPRHLAGRSNVSIAAEIGVSEATVRDDLKRLNELWLERTAADQAELRARVLAELEDVRTRAIAAAEFDERCERAVLFGAEQIRTDDKGSATFRGNKAAALAQARQATMDKAKVLGIDVNKLALTDSQGDDIPLAELMERYSRRQGGSSRSEDDAGA